MQTIINIVLFILILGILVFVHELGHFLTAKKSGVFIHEFSIGMGPLIKTVKGKDGINYSIRALPLGGYVQMAGEIYEDDETNTVPKEKFMCNRPWWHRLIILCAGVFNNFLLALVLLFTIALIWGSPSLKPVISEVVPESAIEEAGIVQGDVITKINGSKIKTTDKAQLYLVMKSKSDTYEITVKHKDGSSDTYKVTPKEQEGEDGKKVKVFGFKLGDPSSMKKGFVPAVKYAFQKMGSTMEQMWLTLVNLCTGHISVNNLSGPVGIYSVVGEARKTGVENVLFLMAYLSINLGIMNILPIPALDGGHVLFLIIELITRKRVNEKVESVTTTIFFALLMLLMLYVTVHDIIRLFF